MVLPKRRKARCYSSPGEEWCSNVDQLTQIFAVACGFPETAWEERNTRRLLKQNGIGQGECASPQAAAVKALFTSCN